MIHNRAENDKLMLSEGSVIVTQYYPPYFMSPLKRISVIFLILISMQVHSLADWPCRTDMSVPVATDVGNQWNTRLANDGAGGAIFVWQDRRNGSTDKLFVQRIDAVGNPLWQNGGVQVSLSAGFQYYPQIVSDGQGGAIIVWEDNRNGVDYDIYAQHISPNGVMQWVPGGSLVCNAAGQQYFPQIITDGSGGVIITWQDRRNGQYDIYSQRLTSAGNILWQFNGVPVTLASSDQIDPHIAADKSGGAIISWTDYRAGASDIYVQHVDASGTPAWQSNGVAVVTASNNQWNNQLCSDALGGAIITWQDKRFGSLDKVFAQRIDANGSAAWTSGGVQLSASDGFQYYPRIVNDGLGGAVVTWQDNRSGIDYDVYAQRVDAAGQLLWSTSGIPVCTVTGHQYSPQLVKDGSSLLFTWQDKRNGADFDIYIQRFSLSGQAQWITNGVAVCVAPQDQFSPQLSGDLLQGAVVAWSDYRGATGFTDVYAQRIGANGKAAGGCYRSFTQDEFGLKGTKRLRYNEPIPPPNAGNLRDSIFYRGVYPDGIMIGIDRSDSASRYGWEYFSRSTYVRRALPQNGTARPFRYRGARLFVGVFRNPTPRVYSNHLAAELLTLKLNIAASDVGLTDEQYGDLVFKDTSRVTNPLNNKSLRDITNSVDSMLTFWKKFQGKVDYLVLDASLAKINRAFHGDFQTVSTNPLRAAPVQSLFAVPYLIPSANPPASIPTYHTRPVDNELPEDFNLSQNYPNPFNPSTTIEFTLPEDAFVSVKVFNILGQEVTTLLDHTQLESGLQYVEFDGSNISSGVYFYQLIAEPVESGRRTLIGVNKMVLMK